MSPVTTGPGLFDVPPRACRSCGRGDGWLVGDLCATCIKSGAPTPLDLEAARASRDAAVAQVDDNADDRWRERALATVRRVCEQRPRFIVDDVWRFGLDRPREARAIGPVMIAAEKAGWCRKTDDFEASAQPQCHANPRRVRVSLIHCEAQEVSP